MAINYPASLDTSTTLAQPLGTQTQDNPDHATAHTNASLAIIAVETAVGTTSGTNVLLNFAAGNFPVRINSTNVLQQNLSGTFGTFTGNLGTLNTMNFFNGTIGTPTFTGGTIAIAGTTTPLSMGAAIAPTVVTLADASGGTITANAQAASVFHIIFGTNATNRTIGTPQNMITDGQIITYRIKQNAANVGTVLWHPIFRMSDAGSPSMGTASTYNYFTTVGFTTATGSTGATTGSTTETSLASATSKLSSLCNSSASSRLRFP